MERTPEAYTRGLLAAVLDPWVDGLEKVSSAYQKDKGLQARIADLNLDPAAKLTTLEGVLPANAPATMRNFLGVLLANNDFGKVSEILATLKGMLSAQAAGPQQATVTSAIALTPAEQQRLRAHLAQQFGDNLDLDFQVEPDILGGLVIRVGDKLIDDSVRGRIDALRNTLGVHSA